MDEFGKTIYKIRVGSHLYGLNRPTSDEDFLGIFMPSSAYLFGLKKVEEVDNSTKKSDAGTRNTAEDVDDKSYSLHKFMHLLLNNNPNIVEVLFATPENILIDSPQMVELRENFHKIVSQRVFHTFTGYALSQKKKLTVKSERFTTLVRSAEYLERQFGPELKNHIPISETWANSLNALLKYYKGDKYNCESFHEGMDLTMIYEKIISERDNYGWRVHTDTFDKLGYDVKFGYHLIRILAEGWELLSTGKLQYPISGEVRDEILRVRNGEVELQELLEIYEKWDKLCSQAFELTKLPKTPDWNWANQFTISKTKQYLLEEA